MEFSYSKLRRSSSHWLLTSRSGVHEIFLTFSGREAAGGVRTLPVFSGERAAEVFIASSPFDEETWRARRTASGELISILYGPCEKIGRVALDPMGFNGFDESGTLQNILSPMRFVDMLLGRDRHWFEENRRCSGVLPEGGPQVVPRVLR